MPAPPQGLDYGAKTRTRIVSPLLWIGLAVLLVGVGPLLAYVAAARLGPTSDPNPNPVGPGILAFLTLWPGVGLTAAGQVVPALRWRGRRG